MELGFDMKSYEIKYVELGLILRYNNILVLGLVGLRLGSILHHK